MWASPAPAWNTKASRLLSFVVSHGLTTYLMVDLEY